LGHCSSIVAGRNFAGRGEALSRLEWRAGAAVEIAREVGVGGESGGVEAQVRVQCFDNVVFECIFISEPAKSVFA
jgi:hypothetical protein